MALTVEPNTLVNLPGQGPFPPVLSRPYSVLYAECDSKGVSIGIGKALGLMIN
jgi:hypothetical protein